MKLEDHLKILIKTAKFELTPEEIKLFLPDLKNYIEALDELDNMNLEGLKPSSRPFEVYSSKLREDVAEDYPKDLKKWSPKHCGDYFFFDSFNDKVEK